MKRLEDRLNLYCVIIMIIVLINFFVNYGKPFNIINTLCTGILVIVQIICVILMAKAFKKRRLFRAWEDYTRYRLYNVLTKQESRELVEDIKKYVRNIFR